ncbi:MAG: hypothetical protein ABSB40_07225 [Nitrososphaeria archaeon]|jgi:hypothetical protein
MVELVDDLDNLKEHAAYCRVIAYIVEVAGRNPPKNILLKPLLY